MKSDAVVGRGVNGMRALLFAVRDRPTPHMRPSYRTGPQLPRWGAAAGKVGT